MLNGRFCHLGSLCFRITREQTMDLEEGGASGASETQMMLMQEEEENLEALRRREEDLGRLCEDITEINIIFQDLATMVHQQGNMVDRIENETEEAHNDIEEANPPT